jgi:hypothetical protein
MVMDEDALLDEFKRWIRQQAMYVIPDHPLMQEQIDDAPFDYIVEFCEMKRYKESTEETMLNWIALRNEVFVFLEENGIHSKDNV